MASWFSNLINNLSDKIQCKYGHSGKKCETCAIIYRYCDSFFEYGDFKDDLIE